jgi:predicted kinase
MKGVEVDVQKLLKMGLNPDKFTVKLIPLNKTENSEKNGLETFANYENYQDLQTLAESFRSAGIPVVFDAIAKCEEAGLCCGQLAHQNR